MNKEVIRKNFSRYAQTYDKYADIQRRTASELLGLINKNGFRRILEIGCGTGNYTLLLRNKFKDARLSAIDVSPAMIQMASAKLKESGIKFSVADAEELNLEGNFDLITSNACFQWFEDLGRALERYAGYLYLNGRIIFSIFGPDTFKELNEVLESLDLRVPRNGFNLVSGDKLKVTLANNFKEVKIEEFTYEEDFPCLKDLLRKIKYTGTRGEGLGNKKLLTAGALRRVEGRYLDKFNKIKATYQVFFCRAKK